MPVETPVKSEVDKISEMSEARPTLSVLVPITERHDDLHALYVRVVEELAPHGMPLEFIFVLDGPYFSEAERQLCELKAKFPHVRAYKLNRVLGGAAALRTAAMQARGQIILTLAPYFQLVPGGVARIVNALNDGYDLVVARRHPRVDSWFNRLQSRVFHLITNALTGARFQDLSCGFRAMKATVLREVPLYGDLHRFLPLMAYKEGFRVTEVDVPQHPANAGTRLFQPGVYFRRLLDILTVFFLFKFTRKPLRFFGLLGMTSFGCGFVITTYLTVLRVLHETALAHRPLLLLGVFLMALGIQIASLGLIGEIIVFNSSDHVDEYKIQEILG